MPQTKKNEVVLKFNISMKITVKNLKIETAKKIYFKKLNKAENSNKL